MNEVQHNSCDARYTSGVAVLLLAAAAVACGDAVPDSPTFNAHVAPILHDRCARCHRPDGVAPFPLLTWDDARAQAPLIAAATRAGRMPPWLPGPSDYAFADELRLSDREIAILERWAGQGAPRGAGEAPVPPTFASGWQLGEPDLVLELPEPYELGMTHADVFRNFVIPVPLQATRHVRGVELQPGHPTAVHHAVVAVDPTATSRQDDAADPAPGFDGMFSRRTARPPPGFFIGWTPGRVARPNPAGLSWQLEPGTDLVLQMHMRPHGDSARVQPRIALYFADAPSARTPVLLRLGSQTLDIPPGDDAYTVTDSLRIPVDVELLSLYPHAHYLGRVMDVRVTLPGGAERSLLRIDRWDFNWQDAYAFARPVALPAGSVIRLRYVYDNSAANPHNPQTPPQRVVYGPNTTDEMAELWIQAVPRLQEELAVLQREITRKATRDYVQGWEHLVRVNPGDAVAHASLAAYQRAAGNLDRAVAHYRSAVEAQPAFAAAHYNLALLLEEQGDPDGAVHHYREALRSRPDHAGTHNNLGNVLLARGRAADAAVHFRRAIEIDPDAAEAHNNLGRMLWDQGRTVEAIAHYRRAIAARPASAAPRFNLALALASEGSSDAALAEFEEGARLAPDAIEAYLSLAWLLATHPDSAVRQPELALGLGTRAARLLGRPHERILDVIAAAEAGAGRFERATLLAEEAARLAAASGDQQLSDAVRARLELYREHRPYRAARGSGPRAGR